jgi:hypothetical protein
MEAQNDFALAIKDTDADASRLQRLTRDLSVALDRQQDLRARIPEEAGRAGSKGDPITLGAIVVTLGAVGIKSLMSVLKAYIERKPSLSIEITRPERRQDRCFRSKPACQALGTHRAVPEGVICARAAICCLNRKRQLPR